MAPSSWQPKNFFPVKESWSKKLVKTSVHLKDFRETDHGTRGNGLNSIITSCHYHTFFVPSSRFYFQYNMERIICRDFIFKSATDMSNVLIPRVNSWMRLTLLVYWNVFVIHLTYKRCSWYIGSWLYNKRCITLSKNQAFRQYKFTSSFLFKFHTKGTAGSDGLDWKWYLSLVVLCCWRLPVTGQVNVVLSLHYADASSTDCGRLADNERFCFSLIVIAQ